MVSYTYLKGADSGDTLLPEIMIVNGPTYGYAYDCPGNLISVTENGTEILHYTYNFLDELLRADDRTEGKSHAWSYDAGGNRTEERVRIPQGRSVSQRRLFPMDTGMRSGRTS